MALSISTRGLPSAGAPASRRRPSVMGYVAAGAVGLAMWASLLTMVF